MILFCWRIETPTKSASHPATAGRPAAGEETADTAHAAAGVRIGETI